MRPPKETTRSRTRGVQRTQLWFKADADVQAYVENEAQTDGWSVTAVLNDMVTTQIDLEKKLGELWWEIEAEAVRQRKAKGEVLAELVARALKQKK